MALHTLRAMAGGGMYDQIGGGFARYSVDARWVIPHFEKMLYDNALLARAYLHGWQVSGEALLRARVHGDARLGAARPAPGGGRLRLLARRRLRGRGGPLLRLDARTRCARWRGDGRRVAYFGLDGPPNFEGALGAGARGPRPRRTSAAIKAALREVRERRVWPGLDDKRLTSWNALMISALADAGGALERPDYLDAAVACAEFVWRDLRDADGRLLRTYNRGRAHLAAYLEDHAFLLEAMLTLYGATFDPRWFAAARELAETILGALRRRRARRLLLHGRRPRGARRAAQGHRGHADPGRRRPPPRSACCGWARSPASTATRRRRWACCACCTRSRRSTRPRSRHLLQALDFHLAAVKEVAIAGRTPRRWSASCAARSGRTSCSPAGPADGVPLLAGPRARRRPRGGLRLRALHLPAAGDDAGRARRAALTRRREPESSLR